MNKFLWEKPPTNPLRIARKECHIWKVDLRAVNKENCQLDILSEEEKKCLSSFKFEKDRFRYGITHSIKRWVLASYLNEQPEKLEFIAEKYGKPLLSPQQNWLNLQFNLSHSHQLILMALTLEDPIGIDVEYHTDGIDLVSKESVANLIFSSEEKYYFFELKDEQEKIKYFFQVWTQKEAYLKAKGLGLTDLTKVSVGLNELPTDNWLETLTLNKKENLFWKLFPLDVDKSYTAAIVSANYPKGLIGYTADYIKILNSVDLSE